MKKISLIAFVAGLLILLTGVLAPIVILEIHSHKGIGIIGGADREITKVLSRQIMNGLFWIMKLLGSSVALSGLFCLVFPKTVSNGCTLSTSMLALGISASLGIGTYCALELVVCLAFSSELSRHPIAVPVCAALGTVCLIALCFLALIYFKKRSDTPSTKGIFIDVTFALLYVFPFFVLTGFAHSILSNIVR